MKKTKPHELDQEYLLWLCIFDSFRSIDAIISFFSFHFSLISAFLGIHSALSGVYICNLNRRIGSISTKICQQQQQQQNEKKETTNNRESENTL